MPIYLSNADQERAITPDEAVLALEAGLRAFARGDAIRRPRIDNVLPTGRPGDHFSFSSMEGGITGGYWALRIKPDISSRPVAPVAGQLGKPRVVTYSYRPGLNGGMVFLYSTDNAEFLAFMNDGFVHHLRVAATAALGVKYFSRPDSRVLGIYGSGGMAHTFPRTIETVRPIERVQAWSPNRANLEAYVAEMRPKLRAEIVAVDTPEEVARGADIVCCCTSSRVPVLETAWIVPGMHINNVLPWELSQPSYERIDVAGLLLNRAPISIKGLVDKDLILGETSLSYIGGPKEFRERYPHGQPGGKRYKNARYVVADLEHGTLPDRGPEDVSILSNNSYGTLEGDTLVSSGHQGIQFASVAGKLYEGARKLGLGQEFPREMFLQDIHT